jgi:ABC-type polysaccharide/polyol phosphate export permease
MMRPPISLNKSIRIQCRLLVRLSLATASLGYPICAFAGPIGAIDAMFTAVYWYIGIVICVSVVALFCCRYIRNRRLRAFMRLLIVVFLYTPIPFSNSYLPAFLNLPASVFVKSRAVPPIGVTAHPIALSYGIALLTTLPLLMFGIFLMERHSSRKTRQP